MKNKKDWEIEKLGELSEVITKGTTPSSIGYNFTDSGVNYIKLESLTATGDIIPKKVAYISEECHNALKRSQLKENDILFSIAGALGRIGIVKKEIIPANTNQALAIIRLKEKTGISIDYLAKYLTSDYILNEIEKLKGGVAQQNLSLGQLNNLLIPIPPIRIQQQIVSELDALISIITNKKQQLVDLDKLAQATFYEMFGDLFFNDKRWNFVELNKICAEIVDCPHSTPKKSEIPTVFPCIRTSELKKGQIEWKSMQYVDVVEYEDRVKRLIPQKGDIVYGREGSYGDAVCLPDTHKFCLGQRTMLFRPKTEIVNSIYLLHVVISEFVYTQAKRKNSGSTVGHVNVADIKKFSIPIPQLNLQNKFAERIEAIEKQKELITKSIVDVQQLFESTMDKYFND